MPKLGFECDFTNMPTDEERWRELLARLEAEFADIEDSAVHSRDDETPGMLLMIERCIDSGYYDLAASIVGDLRGGKAQRLGALARMEFVEDAVEKWHALAKPVWVQLDRGLGYSHCARTIKKRLGNLVPGIRQIKRAIKKWEEEEERLRNIV